jgi:hypothetical protein
VAAATVAISREYRKAKEKQDVMSGTRNSAGYCQHAAKSGICMKRHPRRVDGYV